MRYPVRNLCPRNTPPEVRESKLRAAGQGAPLSRKTIHMPIRRARQIRACSTTHSDAHKRDGRRERQGEPLRSRSVPASHLALACPMTCFYRRVIPLLRPGKRRVAPRTTRRPASFPHSGRTLTDDVVSDFFSMLTNGRVAGDKPGPHGDLLNQFPYIGPPHD
jgi:hypothetical protein